jgi:hypothetical protein
VCVDWNSSYIDRRPIDKLRKNLGIFWGKQYLRLPKFSIHCEAELRKLLLIWLFIAVGLLVTMLSGFYGRNFGSGASTDVRYGLPFPWHGESNSADSDNSGIWYIWANFFYDAVAWAFVVGIFSLPFVTHRR